MIDYYKPLFFSKLYNRSYHKANLYLPIMTSLILPTPIPARSISTSELNQKIHNPQNWVIKQIHHDFSKYDKFSSQEAIETFEKTNTDDWFVLFMIKDGKIKYHKKQQHMNGAANYAVEFYANILKYLAEKKHIKSLVFNMRLTDTIPTDYSQSNIRDFAPILAVTTNSEKHIDKDVILIPDWMNLESSHKTFTSISKANKKFPWENKIDTVFWRGGEADVTGYRHKIVDLSNTMKHQGIDAQFTYGPNASSEYVAPKDHIPYKFQINIDGHTAAWERPVWQLQSNSVVLKQHSPLIQWYYRQLKPDVHYIDVGENPEDILKILSQYNDEELKKIAEQSQKFALENLMIEDMMSYLILVLQKYERLQNS